MFTNTPVYRVDDALVFGLRQPVAVPNFSDRVFTVSAQFAGRIDAISNIFYGRPDYWWAVADLNPVLDPLLVKTGDKLRVGSRQNLPL